MKKIFNKILVLSLFVLFLIPCYNFAETTEPDIYCGAAVVIHPKTDTVLYDKNAHQKMYPASTTKIMTALVALESGHDLSEKVTVTENAISSIIEGYSTAHLKAGEQVTLEQLINVLLIPSANDSANVIAEYIGGSIPEFVAMMNKKAEEIGCNNTHFMSPNGLHNENHYTTPYDLAHIAIRAMKNETFRNVVSKTSYSLPATEQYPYEDRIFTSTNNLLLKYSGYYYEGAIGIKTGFTSQAGSCLVAGCFKDDAEIVSVVMDAEGDGRFSESIKLLDYIYETFGNRKVASSGDIITETTIKNATNDTKELNALLESDIIAFCKKDSNKILPKISLKDDLIAPIKKGDVIGTVKYTVGNYNYESNLIAEKDVEPDLFFVRFMGIVLGILALWLLYIVFGGKKKKKRKKKKKKPYNHNHNHPIKKPVRRY